MASSLDETRRGRMLLKDFLRDHHHELPSCSSSTINNLKKNKSWNQTAARKPLGRGRRRSSRILLLSRHSIKAASVSISAASDMVINAAIKFFPYIPTVKTTTPAITPPAQAINHNNYHQVVSVNHDNKVVKIKDILRWKSFRDNNIATEMDEEIIIMPLQNQHNNSTTVSVASATDLTLSGKTSNSLWSGNDALNVGEDKDGVFEFNKHYLPESPADKGTTVSKRELEFNEEDQHSPVSVLDSPFQEDEAFSSASSFQRNLASIERRKCRLMQKIEEFERLGYKNLEISPDQLYTNDGGHDKHITTNADDDGDAPVRERATQLLSRAFKGTAENSDKQNNIEHRLLFDYFIQELTTATGSGGCKLDGDEEILRFAESWLSKNGRKEGSKNGGYYCWEWKMMMMEKSLRDSWNYSSFEKEDGELGCKLEKMVLNGLIDEILFDHLSIKSNN